MAKKKVLDETQTVEVVAAPDMPEVPFEEHEAPIEAETHAAIELVTDPGMKKTILFEDDGAAAELRAAEDAALPDDSQSVMEEMPAVPGRRGDDLGSIHAGVDQLGPDPNFSGRPRGANLGPIPIRSRTVFRTDSGGEVRSYESPTSSTRILTVTTRTEGRDREVPFESSMVDSVVGDEAPATPEVVETVVETTAVTETREDRPRRRFGFFGRKAPKPEFHADGKGDPDVKHVYQTAVPVDSLPGAASSAPPEPSAAWDPSQTTTTTVVFEERAPVTEAPLRPHVAVRSETWRSKAKRTVRRAKPKAAKKAVKAPPRKAKAKPRKATMIMAYPGDNHPIIDIEGIGPKYAKRLEKAGITTTGLLAVTKLGKIAKASKAPKKTVKGWLAQADLLKVKGVGPQYAEAMARAGIRGIDDLKKRPADKMSKQVTKYLDSLETNVVGQPVTTKRMAKWKVKAARMRKVKVDKAKLAIPDHGIPPPWLREKAGKKSKRTTGK